MGILLGIAVREKSRSPMQELTCVQVTAAAGVAEDFRGKPGLRQVTVLAREQWQATCEEVGETIPWLARRANLYIEGVALRNCAGRVLKIGSLRLLITHETDPCKRMTEVHDGLFDALAKEWRGGVCCRVIVEGEICVGDQVEMVDAQ